MDINMSVTKSFGGGQKAVIRSDFEKDVELNPVSGYTPAVNDAVGYNTADSKHVKYSTDVATHELEGVITEYDATTKAATVVYRGRVQLKDLAVTIGSGKGRAFERTCRGLGLDLV